MIIYVIEEGCQFEGTGIISLHLTEEGAVKKAENIVATSRMREYTKRIAEGGRELHRWADGNDISVIDKHETEE